MRRLLRTLGLLAFAIGSLCWSSVLLAASPTKKPVSPIAMLHEWELPDVQADPPQVKEDTQEQDDAKAAKLDTMSFDNIKSHFGAAISVTLDTGTRSRIEDAKLVDGADGKKYVRVTRDHDQVARMLLEAHFLLWTGKRGDDYQWGVGPFVGVQPGSDNIIEAAALGAMIAFRSGATGRTGFSLGIGIIGDPKVKVLGDGIEENQPLPPGETEIRFKETGQGGLLILAGFVF